MTIKWWISPGGWDCDEVPMYMGLRRENGPAGSGRPVSDLQSNLEAKTKNEMKPTRHTYTIFPIIN